MPVVVGVLGAEPDMFDKHMEKLGTTIRIEVVQKTALLGTARLPRADLHNSILSHATRACEKLTTGLRHDLRLSQRFKTCFKMLRHFP